MEKIKIIKKKKKKTKPKKKKKEVDQKFQVESVG